LIKIFLSLDMKTPLQACASHARAFRRGKQSVSVEIWALLKSRHQDGRVVTRNLTKNLTPSLDQNLFKFRHENPSSSVRKPRAGIPPRKTER
jgi:FMN-dependent NADH-azoreductase